MEKIPPESDSWLRAVVSCNRAVRILRSRGYHDEPYVEEDNLPANWDEMARTHRNLWELVYSKSRKKKS